MGGERRARADRGVAIALVALVALMLLNALALGCATSQTSSAELPHLPVALRVDLVNGNVLTLGSLRGRVVLVTVMTTWADPALSEVPRFKELLAKTDPKQFAIVAIVLEKPELARIFARAFRVPYYVGTVDDPAELTGPSGPLGPVTIIPTSALLDRDGRIAARMDGIWPKGLLEEAVGRLVASDRSSR